MKTKKLFLLISISFIFFGCSKEPVIQTEIEGLDLSKEQHMKYFMERPDQTQKFISWCNENMPKSIPEDRISKRFKENCITAMESKFFSRQKLEGNRKYNHY